MCMGAIIWCGVGRRVYAASVAQIGEKMNQIMITSADVAAKAAWDPIKITGGVLADQAVPILAR
jgi:tRNA(adenine34) deaminase